jgi:hypothetical protein
MRSLQRGSPETSLRPFLRRMFTSLTRYAGWLL